MFIEAVRYSCEFGEGTTPPNLEMLSWIDTCANSMGNIYLKARMLELQVALGFYHSGNYIEGFEVVKKFLIQISEKTKITNLDPRTNARLGLLQFTLAEYLTTEAGLGGDFEGSMKC